MGTMQGREHSLICGLTITSHSSLTKVSGSGIWEGELKKFLLRGNGRAKLR